MNENENAVNAKELPLTENVEQTTEETPKMYTEAELNARVDELLGKKIARREAKIRKEYDRKYGELEEVLRAGTGKANVDEMTDTFKKFYQGKGIKMPEKPQYSAKDLETLAKAEAEDIIKGGYEDVVEEVERLTEIGAANMTAREKAVFRVLAEHRQNAERGKELAKIGVTEDVYNSKDFKEFQNMFNPNTPIADVYNLYSKTRNKKDIKPMGSMKNTTSDDNGVKDFYSFEEAQKFTVDDFNKKPDLYEAVKASMPKWK